MVIHLQPSLMPSHTARSSLSQKGVAPLQRLNQARIHVNEDLHCIWEMRNASRCVEFSQEAPPPPSMETCLPFLIRQAIFSHKSNWGETHGAVRSTDCPEMAEITNPVFPPHSPK